MDIAADVTHPQGYIRYSRAVAVTRLALVGGLVMLLAAYTTPRIAALGAVEFALYLGLLVASELARRDADGAAASRRLRWQADGIMVLLVANACLLAAALARHDEGRLQPEAALLAIAVLLFASLRAQANRWIYAIAVTPPALTLVWLGFDAGHSLAPTLEALAMILFVGAVLLATWRQQSSDTALGRAAQDLRRKSLALNQAVDEAKAAAGAKARLLAATSHELRTPLNAVIGFAQALRREPLPPREADLARGIVDGGEQLSRLLDGILAAADGGERLEIAPLDLRRQMEGLVRVWREPARAIGVDLIFVDDDPRLTFEIVADAGKLEQALVTLVAGALKATPAGGRVWVRLAGLKRGRTLSALVEVRDSGAPMSLLDRARAFETFGDTERGRQMGDSGVGLSLCSANMELMRGEVGVDAPADGIGAVFWFAFNAPVHAPSQASDVSVARQLRVLAAEDNPANRRVLAALLSHLPVELVFAEDGAKAVAAWREAPFDLVLMDANMPVMSGVDAVRTMRSGDALEAKIPIWMLTANVSDDDVAGYHAAGADGILRKPIDSSALFALLGEVAGVSANG